MARKTSSKTLPAVEAPTVTEQTAPTVEAPALKVNLADEALVATITTAPDMVVVPASEMRFAQDRTKATQLTPFAFYAHHSHPDKVGSYGAHQFGGKWGPSNEVFRMPSRALLETTGNPYNADMADPLNVSNDPRFEEIRYKVAAVMQALLWDHLLQHGSASAYDLFLDEAFNSKVEAAIKAQRDGKAYTINRSKPQNNLYLYQILHTLRDLEAVCLVYAEVAAKKERTTKTVFTVQAGVRAALT